MPLSNRPTSRGFRPLYWLCIFLLPTTAANAQAVSSQVQSALDSLLRQGEIRTRIYAFDDSTVLALERAATFQELLTLSQHPAALVRVAALYGLLQRERPPDELTGRQPYLKKLLEEHFMDTASVQWQVEGEYRIQNTYHLRVGEFYLSKLGHYWTGNLNSVILSGGYSGYIPLDSMWHFDSLLVLEVPNPWASYRFARIRQLEPIPTWYSAIRRQVAQTGDEIAVCYLAKYQRPEDIDLILRHLPGEKPGFDREVPGHWQPFQYFRHPQLFEYLRQHQPADCNLSKNETLALIAAYQTPAAAALLDSLYECARKDAQSRFNNVSTVSMKLQQQFVPVYAPLLWKILLENPENPNVRIPDQLWDTYGDSLAILYDRWKTGGRGARERATAMFPRLSNYWAVADKRRQINVVLEQLQPGDIPREDQVAWATIWLARDSAYTAPLFTLLEKEPLPENRFFIGKIILHQPDAGIRQRLKGFFQLHAALYPTIAAAEKGGDIFSTFYHYVKEKR